MSSGTELFFSMESHKPDGNSMGQKFFKSFFI